VIRFSVRNVDGAEAGAPLFAAPAATPVGKPLDDPIPLPDGRKRLTLKEAKTDCHAVLCRRRSVDVLWNDISFDRRLDQRGR
jgi:hypothetical protein